MAEPMNVEPSQALPGACVCDPNPTTTEGPVAWCDVHGLPSAAFAAGYQAAIRDLRDAGLTFEVAPDGAR